MNNGYEAPAYEPLPQPQDYYDADDRKFAKEMRRTFWIGVAIVTGVSIGAFAFVIFVTWSAG
jgi:hypothetical protein